MKRGLKAHAALPPALAPLCYNRYPDEKGTESLTILPCQRINIRGYNRYPDEKGTERSTSRRAHRSSLVTTVTPMKRGLKAASSSMSGKWTTVTTVTPMKRGLKAETDVTIVEDLSLQPLPR